MAATARQTLGFAQQERNRTQGHKADTKTLKDHTPHFCASCALICAFSVPFPFRWAKPQT
jgi:hypothetical protein